MERIKPPWLDVFLAQPYFHQCPLHRGLSKNDVNNYCIDCGEVMCRHCLRSPEPSDHCQATHTLLKIRKYVYQNVIKIDDINKLVDCSRIQTFIANHSRVVLLNPKQNCKRREGHVCEICERSITEPFRFCSIACSVSEESQQIIGHLQPDDSEDVRDNESNSSQDQTLRSSALAATAKIRKRKGKPRRSFLF